MKIRIRPSSVWPISDVLKKKNSVHNDVDEEYGRSLTYFCKKTVYTTNNEDDNNAPNVNSVRNNVDEEYGRSLTYFCKKTAYTTNDKDDDNAPNVLL